MELGRRRGCRIGSMREERWDVRLHWGHALLTGCRYLHCVEWEGDLAVKTGESEKKRCTVYEGYLHRGKRHWDYRSISKGLLDAWCIISRLLVAVQYILVKSSLRGFIDCMSGIQAPFSL